MKKKLIAVVIVFVVVISAIAYYNFNNASSLEIEGEKSYSYADVEKGDISIDIMADGQIDIVIRDYKFEKTGVVESIDVSIGQEVTKGEKLATINTSEIENDLYDAKLNLENLLFTKEKNNDIYSKNILNYNYELNQLKINCEVLESDYEDMKKLVDIFPLSEIEDSKRNYEFAINDYENYKIVNKPVSNEKADLLDIEKAKNTVEKFEIDLKNSTIYALSNGTVIDINVVVGENVATSDVILEVEDEEKIYVTTNLQEIDILSIVNNQKAYIELEAMIGKQFEARVVNIDRNPIIDSNGIVNYQVTLELIENDKDIMDGMTVSSTFIIVEKLDVIKIPNKAVKKVGSSQIVNVMTGENTAEERIVTTGLTDGRNVEIFDGLSVGERLVYEN
jgi:macrolide-specific efflux system membrane fusion protein